MTDTIQNRLLRWATAFLFIFSVILTLSPAVRERAWDVEYRWSHWLGFAVWFVAVRIAHLATARQLPDRDPYIFPSAALLSGWGLLTVWRLDPVFGMRQTVWLIVSVGLFIAGILYPDFINSLRRYKYILLSGGLSLTALTLIFGTTPSGYGPRLWLGFSGVYFQPSEPLKLLFVVYLAAYLADRAPIRMRVFPFILPTIMVTGLALLVLIVQRDLGTASIFILLYATILYLATNQRRVLLVSVMGLISALIVGYISINIIRVRVDGWLNPWGDPSGQSYQIVQSLLAIANGGTVGRGVGLGSPGLVPVAISDFIFSAVAEETGLAGTIGLVAIIWLILTRGIVASLRASDKFRRLLAAGVTAYLGIQSLLIIGGNLRLLPLTGVTLPFVSYGGSSLLTSFVALLILLVVGNHDELEPASLKSPQPYSVLASLLGLGFAATALASAYWATFRSPDLLTRTDNARRAIADRYVLRGSILDRNNQPINVTRGDSGSFERVYLYPDLGPITGYTHPVYGQAGLEASLDDYLRGYRGNPSSLIWWDHLLYGTPPTGINVRLSIDLSLQTRADQLLKEHKGAILLMNARTGEILVMASYPTYNPNELDQIGSTLGKDPTAPLLNRASQGQYPIGTTLFPLLQALSQRAQLNSSEALADYEKLGLFQTPVINLPVSPAMKADTIEGLHISPLQAALAAAAFSAHGTVPTPRITMAINTQDQGWVVLPALGQPIEALPSGAADGAAMSLIVEGKPYWSCVGRADEGKSTVTWFIAGTLPDWQSAPLVLVVTLEEENIYLSKYIGSEMMTSALNE